MEHAAKALAVAGSAAFLALKINRVLMRRFGEHAVQFLIPLAEEAIKTGSAVLLQFSVVSIHLGFGLCEAGYDLIANPEVGSAKRLGAALLAIAGHGLFGWITWLLMELVGSVFFAVAAAYMVHVLWNLVVFNIKR